ncbi:MAG: hypothetical protein RLY35_1967 [Bacteroidota bacterium]|jgi:lipid II:glycine glycyltransferase (peptidoglycan interpeptide bridge formation enzyme)
MSEEIEIVFNDGIDVLGWTQLLSECEQPSFFQSPKGYQLLKTFHQWEVGAVGCLINGQLRAVLVFVVQKEKGVKAFFSKRCIIFSGPIYTNELALRSILSALEKVSKGSVYLEIRNGHPNQTVFDLYKELGWEYIPWLNFIVDTKEDKKMQQQISESRKRQLKKAEKNGVLVTNPKSESEVKEFYQILKELYQTKIKKPLPDYELFSAFFHADTRNIILVIWNNKVIGGILAPFLEGVGAYEFYIAGLDQAYRDCFPSAMATYGAMKQANALGLRFFDFMGGGSPSESYGVREFKSRFGGEQVESGRWLKVNRKFIYQLGKFYFQMKSR